MHFTTVTILALASSVLAQTTGFDVISQPGEGAVVPAGSTYDITWAPDASNPGPVIVTLLGGASPTLLQDLAVLATGVDGSVGSYSWAVDSTLGSLATYGLQITLQANVSVFQFSFPFTISGGSAAASTSAVASASGTTEGGSSATVVGTTSWTASSSTPVTISTSTSSTSTSTYTALGNGTYTTSFVTTSASKTATKTSSPSTVATGGASSGAVGSLAMLGGLALAALAL